MAEQLAEKVEAIKIASNNEEEKKQEQQQNVVEIDEENLNLFESGQTWEECGVRDDIIKALEENNFYQPSEIQSKSLEYILSKQNAPLCYLGQAKNGSGKTLCFVVSALQQIDTKLGISEQIQVKDQNNRNQSKTKLIPQAIILTPIKELVHSTADIIQKIIKAEKKLENILVKRVSNELDLSNVTDEQEKKQKLREYYNTLNYEGHILVGTPQSIANLMNIGMNANRKYLLSVERLKVLAVDEADAIFINKQQQNNQEDQNNFIKIMNAMKQNHNAHILCFSATFPPQSLEKVGLNTWPNIYKVEVQEKELTLKNIKQLNLDIIKDLQQEKGMKEFAIYSIIAMLGEGQIIIFVNDKKFADMLTNSLSTQFNDQVQKLTGDMKPLQRKATMVKFNENKVKILITTNLLARGYDNRNVSLVINADLPFIMGQQVNAQYREKNKADCETYLHRIGRTGRFGDYGVALNIIDQRSADIMKEIEKHFGIQNEVITMNDLEKLPALINEYKEKTKLVQEKLDKSKQQQK